MARWCAACCWVADNGLALAAARFVGKTDPPHVGGLLVADPVPYLIEAVSEDEAFRIAADRFEAEYPAPEVTVDGESVQVVATVRRLDPIPSSVTSPGPAGQVDLGRFGVRTPAVSPHGGYRWYREPDAGAWDGPEVLPWELFDRLAGGEPAGLVGGFVVRDYPAAEDAQLDALAAAALVIPAAPTADPGAGI
jgi:hypothetical protein